MDNYLKQQIAYEKELSAVIDENNEELAHFKRRSVITKRRIKAAKAMLKITQSYIAKHKQ